MTNRVLLRLVVAGCLVVPVAAHAQGDVVRVPPGIQKPVARMPQQPPCWQVAGISKSAIEQRRAIEQNTKSQVASVCADSSLTVQQKRAKIKEIRQQAHQEIDGVITPEQQQQLKACNAERAAVHPAPAAPPHPAGGSGPCGEMAANPPVGKSGGSPTTNPPDTNSEPAPPQQ